MSLWSHIRSLFTRESAKAADAGPRTWVFVDIDAHYDISELARIAPGLQAQLREDFAPAWGSGSQDVVLGVVMTSAAAYAAGYCQIQLHADAPADEQEALAIHSNDGAGRPIAHAYRKLLEQYNTSLSSAVSHELLEASADPNCTRTTTLPDKRVVAVEIADAVEGDLYTKMSTPNAPVVEVSNFSLPSNFAIGSTAAPFDFLKLTKTIFEVRPGGYAQVLDPKTGWTQLAPSALRAYRAHLSNLALGITRGERRAALT